MNTFKYDICVVGGGGHIGLPLSIAFADNGKNVAIYDTNQRAVEIINQGKMPFQESGADSLLRKTSGVNLCAGTSPSVVSEAKFVIITIGTPVDEHLNPTFHQMKRFFSELIPFLRNDQIIILRSTIYPGISSKIRDMLKEQLPQAEVCFCPERIAEGKAMEELYSLPQIVSGFEPEAIAQVADLFSVLASEVLITEPLEAELAKLFTNSWRYIQFAAANQFYMIAEDYGADFNRIYQAMTKNYPRAQGFARPGFAAGPCLLKDTMQISAYTNNKFFLGHSAMLINEGLPNFIVEQMKQKYDLAGMTVGILGMTFKGESDDIRESLSYKLRKVLDLEARQVMCSDLYCADPSFVSAEELVRSSDAVIIGAPHKDYRALDYSGCILVDIWNLCEKASGVCG